MKIYFGLVLAFAAGLNALEQTPLSEKKDGRPNIVVVLTDDQDVHLDSLSYMPLLKKHVTDQGTLFKRHYCSTAICCPSRVTLWTGRNAHNTNVTDVFPPYGMYAIQLMSKCQLTVQVDIRNSLPKGSTRIGSQSGFKMPDTAPSTQASYSMHTPWSTGIVLILRAGHPLISSSILSRTRTSTRRSREMSIRLLATKVNIPPTCLQRKHTGFLTRQLHWKSPYF